jgi:anti-anti-sigma regulatory factor
VGRTPEQQVVRESSRWLLTSVPRPEGAPVLRIAGTVDVATCGALEEELVRLVKGSADAVVDLREVSVLSVAGAGVLTRLADRLAESGRRLLVVTGFGPPRYVLEAIQADVLELFTSVETATAALAGVAAEEGTAELVRLRGQVHDLREKLRTRPLVARALGVLQERYGLPDVGATNALLREVSQRHNTKVRTVAHAFLAARPPSSPNATFWFPGRVVPPAPPLTFVTRPPADRAALLDRVLDAVLSCVCDSAGAVWLSDPARGGLMLERHRGLPPEVVRFFHRTGAAATVCPTAFGTGTGAAELDLATDPSFTEEVRQVMLAAGSRSVRCQPLLDGTGPGMGTVATYHPERVPQLPEAARGQLDRVCVEAGAWLGWHVRTTTLDVLEHLHRDARAGGGHRK